MDGRLRGHDGHSGPVRFDCAASHHHAVGYNCPYQFSREYRRLFGALPVRVERLRAMGGEIAA